jgi:hypothetical protein
LCILCLQADLDEEGERRLKQLLLVRRIYEKMLLSKLREDQKRCDLFEASFQRIRQSTGLTDVNDIAEKFLSRHTTTENLLVGVYAACRWEKFLCGLPCLLPLCLGPSRLCPLAAVNVRVPPLPPPPHLHTIPAAPTIHCTGPPGCPKGGEGFVVVPAQRVHLRPRVHDACQRYPSAVPAYGRVRPPASGGRWSQTPARACNPLFFCSSLPRGPSDACGWEGC